jgi:glycosyltransferase involved in cell wall biosynthesis
MPEAIPAASAAHPMRILMFIQSLELGGSEKQCVEMARILARDGFDVTVGCMRRTGPLRRKIAEAGLPLVEFPVGSLLRPSALVQMARLVRFIRANKFDVVQANDLYANLFAVPAARLAKARVIVSCQRDLSDWWWYTPRRRALLRQVQRMSSCVLVNSEAIRTQLVEEDGLDRERIQVVHNGIDVGRFKARVDAVPTHIPGISSGDRLIVMVGNMLRQVKGHSELIEAAKTVCEQNRDARFLLIGDGEMRPVFEKQVRAAGLEKSVLFLGHRTDVADILPLCEIGVLASRAEGLPNAVMEYMAAGLATVATPVGGVPEIIEHETSGLLVPVENPLQLSAAILRLLNDQPLRLRLGQAAREAMLSKCDFAGVLSRLKSIYHAPALQAFPVRHARESAAAD